MTAGRWTLGCVTLIVLVAGRAGFGQSGGMTPAKPTESTPSTDPNNPSLWNADRMMEDAVQTLVRRYNLNKEQEEYTRKLLVARTKAFLQQHEAELRQLIKDQLLMRVDSTKGTPEGYRNWGERARPVFEAARKEIVLGNQDWDGILNDVQKQIHAADLAQMDVQFTQIDQMITKWSAGKFDPSDLAPRPPPEVATAQKRGVTRLSQNPPTATRRPEDIWESYVRKFGDVYQLSAEQRNASYAILQDSRAQVKSYRDSRKGELESLEKRFVEAVASGQSGGKALEYRQAMADLEKPVHEIFAAMRGRLDQIPTKAQREAVTKDQLASLDSLAKMASPEPSGVVQAPTTVGPSSAPAKSEAHSRAAQKSQGGNPPPSSAPAGGARK